jgi:serine phosphatase RsbU (regulator of sigma subunit)
VTAASSRALTDRQGLEEAAPLRRAGIASLEPGSRRIGTVLRWTVAAALLVAAFAADHLTGSEVSSSLYYVVAIVYAAWFLGRLAGLGMALLCALAWLAAYALAGRPFSHPAILLWNLFAEVSIYAAMALTMGFLRDHVAKVRALADRLSDADRLLDREALAVGRLQRELLPDALPRIPGYEWSVHYETCTRAGGDYYDFTALAGGRIGILIADASGHGAPAAVLMAMTRALLHMVTERAPTPDRVVTRLNREMGRLLPPGWFVTACYAILDPPSGSLEYSLAGHAPPVVMRARTGSLERLPASGGPLLGPFPDAAYESARTRLEPGDALILYTDGLPETEDVEGRLLGEDAVLAALESAPSLKPAAIRARMLDCVTRHRAGAAATDDLTVLILGREARAPTGDPGGPPRPPEDATARRIPRRAAVGSRGR